MSNSRGWSDDADLEGALADLGQHFPYPPTPNVAAAVESRIKRLDRPSLLLPHRRGGLRMLVLATLAMALLVAGGTIALSPAARAAVAQWLAIPGVRITTSVTTLPPARLGRTLQLGRRVTLADARAHVSFHVLLPALTGLRHPDEVYLDSSPPGGRISLLYRAHPGLPPTRPTGVGLLLTEFHDLYGRLWLGKMVGWKSMPQSITVGTDRGYWIQGAHLTYAYGHTPLVWNNVRLAGNTILWEHAGITFRLESALSERAVLRIATSMR